ncbi:MAG: hypothetical protein ACHQ49_14350 [Elusimicrobiota bacterium]
MRPVLLLLAASSALASHYDPDSDRSTLRRSANAAYDAATRAAGSDLRPERAADIKGLLDACVSQASSASNTAKNMQTAADKRSSEMADALKKLVASAPAALLRARWKTLSMDHDDLHARVAGLPDNNPEKSGLNASLDSAASSLNSAVAALDRADSAASSESAAVSQMEFAQKRARSSAGELSEADAELSRLADSLPPLANDAKGAVDLLGQEPQAANRTRAGQKLVAVREPAGALYSAADRASHRADDFHSRSEDFNRAQTSFSSAQPDDAAAAKAKAALDDADKTQTEVRDRLNHPKS